MDRNPCVWSYVVAHDGGTAPCVDNKSLSLCICKPVIRKNVIVGDWIVGFARKKIGENLIVYAAEVENKIPMEEYFEDPEIRRDKIYEVKAHEFIHYGGDIHNSPKNWKSDISGRFCLISKNFWYFGKDALLVPRELETLYYPHVGQKKYTKQSILRDVKLFFASLDKGVYAEPTDK